MQNHNWECLTKAAVTAYSNRDFNNAVNLNKQALSLLEISFNDDFNFDAESTIAAAAVSFLNLAESYTVLGEFILANAQYENAISFLQVAMSRPDVSDQQYGIIIRTLTRIRCEWQLFSQSHLSELPAQSNLLMETFSNVVSAPKKVIHH